MLCLLKRQNHRKPFRFLKPKESFPHLDRINSLSRRINTADPFWSYKEGLEEELQYKTANQWSRSQAKIRVEGPNTVRARLPE